MNSTIFAELKTSVDLQWFIIETRSFCKCKNQVSTRLKKLKTCRTLIINGLLLISTLLSQNFLKLTRKYHITFGTFSYMIKWKWYRIPSYDLFCIDLIASCKRTLIRWNFAHVIILNIKNCLLTILLKVVVFRFRR